MSNTPASQAQQPGNQTGVGSAPAPLTQEDKSMTARVAPATGVRWGRFSAGLCRAR